MARNNEPKTLDVEQFGGKRGASQMRLPSHDIGALRLLWGGIASKMGLGSNYATMVAGMSDKEGRVVTVRPIDGMQDGMQSLSVHSWNKQVMHIKSQSIVRRGFVCKCSSECDCPVELSQIEKWACWSNGVKDADGNLVEHAYHALEYMIDCGKSDLVGVLFRMYARVTPLWRYGQFQDLEDLVPIALDTSVIAKYATTPGDEWQAMERVLLRKSGDTKAQDKVRELLIKNVKTECGRILILASVAYMEAKKHVE